MHRNIICPRVGHAYGQGLASYKLVKFLDRAQHRHWCHSSHRIPSDIGVLPAYNLMTGHLAAPLDSTHLFLLTTLPLLLVFLCLYV